MLNNITHQVNNATGGASGVPPGPPGLGRLPQRRMAGQSGNGNFLLGLGNGNVGARFDVTQLPEGIQGGPVNETGAGEDWMVLPNVEMTSYDMHDLSAYEVPMGPGPDDLLSMQGSQLHLGDPTASTGNYMQLGGPDALAMTGGGGSTSGGAGERLIVLTESQLGELITRKVREELAENSAFIVHKVREELTENDEFKRKLREELAENAYVRNKRTREISAPRQVKAAVHQVMLRLMGCKAKTKRSSHPRVKPYFDLPDPLPDGAAKRPGPGNSTLWNPDWSIGVDEGINVDFISAAVAVVLETGGTTYHLKPQWLAEPALIKGVAVSYFRHLRRQYFYRKTPEGLARLATKVIKDTRLGRRQRKSNHRVRAIPLFRKAFGRESTVGIERVVMTPLMSSEASTDGEADPEERERMRTEQGAGRRALERRAVVYRAELVTRLYYALDALAKLQDDGNSTESHTDSDDSADSGNESDGEAPRTRRRVRTIQSDDDLPEDERQAFRAELAKRIKEEAGLKIHEERYDRFRGPKANYRTEVRKTKKKSRKPYKQCYAQHWVSSSSTHQRIYRDAPSAGADMTIFQLHIPDEFILEEDRGYLGDAE
ncbi:hypothetical protein OH76DRAFT_1546293 [Lentinus brumalis]|uniref:Uncharacterized protein n=1 Tax=Lentinus brumalis TaxID=2498619 RepID=A0A371CS22_9APHY|nr:hypothetical protein OH76DRAFT_1546293 [Polyporus brumalis]